MPPAWFAHASMTNPASARNLFGAIAKFGEGTSGPAVSIDTTHVPATHLSKIMLLLPLRSFNKYRNDLTVGGGCRCLEKDRLSRNMLGSSPMANCYPLLSGSPEVECCGHNLDGSTSDQASLGHV